MTNRTDATRRWTADESLNETTTVAQTFQYDTDTGLQSGFVQTENSNATPDLTTTITRTANDYDPITGQLSGYTETQQQSGGPVITTERSQMLYTPLGYTHSYDEKITAPAGVTQKSWTADEKGYDGLGHLTGFTEEGSGPRGPPTIG